MLGITGTNGKTTVASMVESGLRAAGRTTGLIGTVGMRVAGEAYPGARTTPEATDLHAALAVMRERGVQSVVMEVSSIARRGAPRSTACATTWPRSRTCRRTTSTTTERWRTTSPPRRGCSPTTVPSWASSASTTSGAACWRTRPAYPSQTWSLLDSHADWRAVREGGVVAVVGPDGERQPLRVPMPGSFNVANAVCAYAVLRAAGVTADAAAAGIAAVEVPGRMQLVGEAGGIRGIVDYAHSPDAIERVLRAAREEADGPGHRRAGRGRGPGPREASPHGGDGGAPRRRARHHRRQSSFRGSARPSACPSARGPTRWHRGDARRSTTWATARSAITVAVGLAEAGDVVLVLGKGHEQGQEAAGVVTPFDDADGPAGRTCRPGTVVIALTAGEIAVAVGGRLSAIDSATLVTDVVRRLPRGRQREPCSSRSAASASTVTTSPRRSSRAGAAAVLAARPLQDDAGGALPCIVVDDPVAALGRLAAEVRRDATALLGRRHHRARAARRARRTSSPPSCRDGPDGRALRARSTPRSDCP